MDTNSSPTIIGHLALNACTVLWGTQHAVVKGLVATTPNPILINAIRFSAAAILTSAVKALFFVFNARSRLDPHSQARTAQMGYATSGRTLVPFVGDAVP